MKNIYFIAGICLLCCLSGCSESETVIPKSNAPETASRAVTPLANDRVSIGTQVWMIKNLSTTKYRNGDVIPQVTDPVQWSTLTTGAWCYYENNPANEAIYGKLYNWYAVNDLRGLAPVGWHIPTQSEYQTLQSCLGGGAVAGGKMKTLSLWAAPNAGADNSSGFTAYPAGYRNSTSQLNFLA